MHKYNACLYDWHMMSRLHTARVAGAEVSATSGGPSTVTMTEAEAGPPTPLSPLQVNSSVTSLGSSSNLASPTPLLVTLVSPAHQLTRGGGAPCPSHTSPSLAPRLTVTPAPAPASLMVTLAGLSTTTLT